MLLEAGFISLFFAPPGFLPGLGRAHPPTRASLFLLRWEWFRIYFESGVAKMASGDLSWRHFTAMDDYYQNGPLPTWIGWYVQHFPHWFHASTVILTFAIELVIVWMVFLPRRFRIICFCIITPFELGIIFTANYAFPELHCAFARHSAAGRSRARMGCSARNSEIAIDRRPVSGSAAEARRGTLKLRTRFAPVRMTIAGICLGLGFLLDHRMAPLDVRAQCCRCRESPWSFSIRFASRTATDCSR